MADCISHDKYTYQTESVKKQAAQKINIAFFDPISTWGEGGTNMPSPTPIRKANQLPHYVKIGR